MSDAATQSEGAGAAGPTRTVRLYLGHYTLYCHDLKTSVEFYTTALPLVNGHRPRFSGPEGAWLYTPDGEHVIHLNSEGPKPAVQKDLADMGWRVSYADRAIDHVAFTVDDFDAAVARLREHGIPHRLESVPDFGYRQAFLRDPDGMGVEINDFSDEPARRRLGLKR